MKRKVAEDRLSDIETGPLDRRERLRALHRLAQELASFENPESYDERWKGEAAESLADLLSQEALTGLEEGVRPETVERLRASIAGGPGLLVDFQQQLRVELAKAAEPRRRLAVLTLRLRCLELRKGCLDHLDTIFDAQRAQP